ncbi:hypothetical protein SKAU_G00093330 [Synaphobranchus kaupii]|uniref:Periaxin n=1 Tax=Synaphobranchus kaupii TaxID=118154 RepID=A0A9Q1FX44_SYNKA|nr:hypothetical protein SKAU_G00093330 [Synaphobranchus kaupii]
MCECLRGIFRVTWTPSSNADFITEGAVWGFSCWKQGVKERVSDLGLASHLHQGKKEEGEEGSDREPEESHVFSHRREPAVKDKERSPPSDRPPAAPHSTPHHGATAEEQESPERVVQKEKLHAELKQVLSLKRNQLKEASEGSMDLPTQVTGSQDEAATMELVEVVVETEAETGASGYSVTGGGERGIFVKEVLKDSPAAKHLSLQKGDQLLSARVYFDNVKYEDALKILQCAEPYKVSFLLKRAVAGTDVTVLPGTANLELKGPKAKMPKMSVKSIKPFKVKKRRGGRFGLKRLKENKKARAGAELEAEGTPAKMELIPVDVEFAFPKFNKLKKGGKASAEGGLKMSGPELSGGLIAAGKKKRKIRFPRLRVKDTTGVETSEGQGAVTLPEGSSSLEVPGSYFKAKGKAPKFGITFPKTKKTKVDLTLPEGNIELKPPEAKFRPPSVEFGFPSGRKDADLPDGEVKEKEGLRIGHQREDENAIS